MHVQRVVGVTFEGRDKRVRRMKIGDAVVLALDNHNPHDAQAVQVLNASGQQLGFISRANTGAVRSHIARYGVKATVFDVTSCKEELPFLVIELQQRS